jgi:hypothetical protein
MDLLSSGCCRDLDAEDLAGLKVGLNSKHGGDGTDTRYLWRRAGGDWGHCHAAGEDGAADGTVAGGYFVSGQEHYFLFSAGYVDCD